VRSQCMLGDCGWESEGEVEGIVGCAATWHVYEDHRDVWLAVCGPFPPRDPDPRTEQGRRLILGAAGVN
jgi:hypothetical protein